MAAVFACESAIFPGYVIRLSLQQTASIGPTPKEELSLIH
jgi:hypothetical protein